MSVLKQRKNRYSLNLIFAATAVGVFFVAMLLAFGVVFLLMVLGVFPIYEGAAEDIAPLFALMIAISLAVGFGTAVLSGKIPLRPVNHMLNTMNRVASGDFTARLVLSKTLRSVKVLREVADSFNTMAEELEKTEMFRSDFVNNFSHEFKTPIVSIAGFAKLLRRGDLTEEQKQEYLAIIEEESLRLADMATNVMNLNKLESQTILTDLSEYNLSEQIRSCVLLLEEKWEKRNITPDLDFREHTLQANEEMMKQVWINLLDNAIKFSQPGSEVTVRMEKQEDQLQICITNYCEDIPPEKLEKIFSKFYQADESHSAQGNGVGLAIVSRVVALHAGTVEAVSLHGATTFTVRLPLTAPEGRKE